MNPAERITVVIADDHPMFRHGLRDTLQERTDFSLVGEAGDGEEAYRLIAERKPRIAILDVEMPKQNGLSVAQRIYEEKLPVSVIILTMYENEAIFNRAMDSGVLGYILKDTAVTEILRGIERVALGEHYFSPALTSKILQRSHTADEQVMHKLGIDRLSATERQILAFIAESMSSARIAERLHISIRTVENHRYNICRKLDLTGSYALLRFALSNKALL